MPIKVDSSKFKKGHQCPAVTQCPMGALSQKDSDTAPEVDLSKCVGCQMCIAVCDNKEIIWED